jgi:RNA polymerase sigma-70 factor (ECF subfamily)
MRTSSPQWSLEFAYAGSFDEQNLTSQVINLQDIDEGTGKSLIPIVSEDDTIQYTNYHYMPITLTLTAHYRQSKRLGVEAGLGYTRLVSDFETKKDSIVNCEQLQTIHYIGVPVKAIYYIYNLKGWNVYGNLGLAMNIPVRSQFNENGLLHNGMENIGTAYTHIPLLWSLSMGFGLQYNLSPHVGIFAEPSVLYYLPTQGGLETYCTEHPFTFSLPLGIKFIW